MIPNQDPNVTNLLLRWGEGDRGALDALTRGTIHNGYLIMALQWIALNRTRLPDLLRE